MSTSGKSPADARRLEKLATTPATRTQVGAIVKEFRRCGIRQRDERLSISAALLDLDRLDSTRNLTMGQAGRLLHTLRTTENRADLYRSVEAANRGRAQRLHDRRATVASVLGNVLHVIAGMMGDTAP